MAKGAGISKRSGGTRDDVRLKNLAGNITWRRTSCRRRLCPTTAAATAGRNRRSRRSNKPVRPPAREPADVPRSKADDPSNAFLKRHEGFLKDLKDKNGKVGILFVGDSSHRWLAQQGQGSLREKLRAPWTRLNIGIGGDRTQHVLWRLDHGESGRDSTQRSPS